MGTAECGKPDKLIIGVLDGMRALMVLLVCHFHIWQQGWLPQYATVLGRALSWDYITRSAYVFVDGLLLLSGFLLYLPYARQRAYQTPVPSVRRFYLNRFARIVPSYLVAVLAMLFLIALPAGAYPSAASLRRDVLTHLTFTYTFRADTYLFTPLNAGLWTLAVEMQFYLLFPLLARAAQRKPALTLGAMAAAGIAYRALIGAFVADTAIYINQLPAFLDVYALGMLGAMVYVRLDGLRARGGKPYAKALSWASPLLLIGACLATLALLRIQSAESADGVAALRLSQMRIRLPLALSLLAALLGACFLPRGLRWLLDNRLMRFLSVISMNLYIWHQPLAVQLAKRYFPDTLHENLPLQKGYTLLCYTAAIVLATLATYGVEKPAARLLHAGYTKWEGMTRHERSSAAKTGEAAH